jgi:hypothetical protein
MGLVGSALSLDRESRNRRSEEGSDDGAEGIHSRRG